MQKPDFSKSIQVFSALIDREWQELSKDLSEENVTEGINL
jgi:hypothetical protein